MKKLLSIVCALTMVFTLCACSTSNNTGTVTEAKTVKEYFDQYETLYYYSSEKGICFVLDDGSEQGLALAVTLNEDQFERIEALDFFSETYRLDMIAITEESNTFTTTSLDGYVPDMTMYDKYIGQKLAVLFDEGYVETSSMISDNLTTVGLSNATYEVNVTVEELASLDQEMNEEFERTLTAKSFEFVGWGSDFFDSLYK